MLAVRGPVVVGADGSEGAETAVRWAAAEAACRDAPLHIVCATALDTLVADVPSESVARRVLDAGSATVESAVAVAEGEASGIRVVPVVSHAAAAQALLEAAGDNGLIVVGTRGSGGFAALLVGSVGLCVAAYATGPVVVVRGEPDHVTTGVVLVAVRDERDLGVVRFAARTAVRYKASLRVLSTYAYYQYAGSMVPLLGDLTEVAEEQASYANRLIAPVRDEFPGLTVTSDLVRAHSPAGALVDASAHADLVVVGARRPAHVPGAPLGHVVHAVLHHAHCPVAVVPHGELHRSED
ncbi:universal stress protein UspA [Streptomyces populi]|uniref:Universal stress protein UspA n=1 Tax=Streptomyces populi TaxID=2058924 RepID=A0A2I0SV31_9ACTN|nr:universal stress protein [Streptomyces populi]PKT73804.1 universal stress protein UspA [Streptomyces populi]